METFFKVIKVITIPLMLALLVACGNGTNSQSQTASTIKTTGVTTIYFGVAVKNYTPNATIKVSPIGLTCPPKSTNCSSKALSGTALTFTASAKVTWNYPGCVNGTTTCKLIAKTAIGMSVQGYMVAY